MRQSYSRVVAQQIKDVFQQKGWNLYDSKGLGERDHAEVIRQGPAPILELNGRYVLLPIVEDPCDPRQVLNALEVLAQKRQGQMPTICVCSTFYPLTGITLRENDVKIHTPRGTFVSYHGFVRSLDSIVQT